MYIVIDISDRTNPYIVTDSETGEPKIFKSRALAQFEADECQNGIVIEY
jgi:hypothetical protein